MFKKPKAVFSDAGVQRLQELEGVMNALDVSQAIIEFEPDGTVVAANSNFLATMGYSIEELIGAHHSIFIAEDEQNSRKYLDFWDRLRSGEYVSSQCRRITRDKQEVWLQANYCPVINPHGEVIKIIKFAIDITEKRLHQADVEGQLNAISRAQATIEFDMKGMVMDANQNFLDSVDYTLEEIKGRHHSFLVHPDESKSEAYANFWKTMQRGEYIAERCRRIGKNGKIVWLQATYNPILDPNGKPIKIVKYATDITAEKQAEEDLEALIKETNVVMGSMAEGDLTKTMQGKYKPELMVLAKSVNRTIEQLGNILSKVRSNAQTLHSSSTHLSNLYESTRSAAHKTADQTQEVAVAAKQISANVDDVVTALDEMVNSVNQVSTNSTEAANVAETAVTLADGAKLNVNKLAESSSDIGAVIKVINSIADQTNLLALNATIEAARAGEAGKGFAVVANEVKELAKETARATEEVSNKISAIQNDSLVAVKAINDISSTIEGISETQSSIAKTVQSQGSVSGAISKSVHAVSQGSSGIEVTIARAATVASENQTRADNSKATTSEMSDLAEELSTLVGQFKLTIA